MTLFDLIESHTATKNIFNVETHFSKHTCKYMFKDIDDDG